MTRPALYLTLVLTSSMSLACLPSPAVIDTRVRATMAETGAKGLAIAVIDDGQVAYVNAYGARNAAGDPLQTDTGESELTIRADGTAIARSLTKNQSFQGTYSDGRLRFDWGTYEVERVRDGIRTIDVNNRNSTEYRRTGN